MALAAPAVEAEGLAARAVQGASAGREALAAVLVVRAALVGGDNVDICMCINGPPCSVKPFNRAMARMEGPHEEVMVPQIARLILRLLGRG